MADQAGGGRVYNRTTEPNEAEKKRCCNVSNLGPPRLVLKVLQLLMSFIAFICEEIIEECEQCGGLYFFEFVSCSAFLLAFLFLVVYCTPLLDKFGAITKIDFWVILFTGAFFLIASITFAATMDSVTLAKVSVAFGFIASFAFLIEAFWLWRKGHHPFQKKPNANGTNQVPDVQQPLNTPVQAQGPETA
ncbi:CKLF-like MARVEL transmembrane domain-containing protein 6 [Discoglossus pictus]